MNTSLLSERDRAMLALRRSGWTLQAIGRRYGVSRESVRQILLRVARVERALQEPGMMEEIEALDRCQKALQQDRLPSVEDLAHLRTSRARLRVSRLFWGWAATHLSEERRMALRRMLRGMAPATGQISDGVRSIPVERLASEVTWLASTTPDGDRRGFVNYAVGRYLYRQNVGRERA